jgi:aspartyl-tRNA(Asn)/glutamyl-tRNA(Gln) amidotransferase subunit A
MSEVDLWSLPGAEQARLIRKKEVSAIDVMTSVLNRIAEINPKVNAFCTVSARALEDAQEADRKQSREDRLLPLNGVPVSIKDLVLTKDLLTTFGSKLFSNYVPDEDDVVVERLRRAGAIIIGKTNVPEFGYHGVTDNFIFGVTRNPWNTQMTAGGSSGGAAAAVAAGMGSLAIGSDGGGSLRIPSSFCGLFTLKGTFGRVPLYPGCRVPEIPGGSSWESLECLGPMTRTVEDSALMLSVIAGHDMRDRHSLPGTDLDYLSALKQDIRGLKVAWSPTLGYATVDDEVRDICAHATATFEKDLGCTVEEVDPKIGNVGNSFWALVAADTDLRGLRRLREEKPNDLSKSLAELLDTAWSAEDFTDAAMVRQRVTNTMCRFMERYDLLLTPTTACAAFPTGREAPESLGSKKEVTLLDWLPFTFPFNMTGQPAANIPAGFTSTGLPVGLQMVGRRLTDFTLLSVAAKFEQARPWAQRWPTIA